MRAERVVRVTVLVLFFMVDSSQGLTLNLNVDDSVGGNSWSCQVLCSEDLQLLTSNDGGNTSRTSGDTLHGKTTEDGGRDIQRMSLFRSSQNVNTLLAEVSTTNNLLTKADKRYSIEGLLTTGQARIQADLSNVNDCQFEFICHVLMTDGQLKVLTTVQYESDNDLTTAASSKTTTSDQTSDLTTLLLSIVGDLNARIASLSTKVDDTYLVEQRLSAKVEQRARDDLVTLEQRLKVEFSDIAAGTTSAEERVKNELVNMEQRQRYALTDIRQHLVAVVSDMERRLLDNMSDVENRQLLNSEKEISQLEDNLKSAILQTGDGSSCSEDMISSIQDGVKQIVKDIENTLSYNTTALNIGHIDKLEQNYFDNISDLLETRLNQEFSSVMRLVNNSFSQNMNKFVKEMMNEINNMPCVSENCQLAQKHSQCIKGMFPISASHPYPYPVFYPDKNSIIKVPFLCDPHTNFGGWIIIQRRVLGNISFLRGWEEYKAAFGSLDGDFWLGLEDIHKLTSSARYELRIDMKYKGKSAYAHYSTFSISSEVDSYRLHLGSYSGTAGDSLTSQHNGMQFSTRDRDNDEHSVNCAELYRGAWWYNQCHSSNLNGEWLADEAFGLRWFTFSKEDSVSFSEMKIRRYSI